MDEMFAKAPAETSEGATASEQTSKGATQENLPPKKQEGSFENLKSQIDKMRTDYEAKLTEKEKAWDEEREQLKGQVQNIIREFETVKNPPRKLDVLTPPKQPDDPTDPMQVLKYQTELIEYNAKVADQKIKTLEERYGKTESQLQKEEELKKQQRMFEANKAKILGDLGKFGTQEEAQEIWENYISKNLFDPESLMEYHRFKKSGKVAPKTTAEKTKFPLPVGISTTANVNENQSSQFMNEIGNNKFNGLFDKK